MSYQYTADGRIKVWVDASFNPNSGRGGIGVWFNHYHSKNVNGICTARDNNEAEALGL